MPSKILKDLRQYAIKRYIQITGIVLIGVLYFFAHLFATLFSDKFSSVPKLLLWQIILYLLATILLLIPLIILLYLKLKNPYNKFDIDDKTGVLKNKKDGHFYCPSCFQKNIYSVLKITENGWQCLNKDCNKFYEKEGYIRPIGYTINPKIKGMDIF